MKNKKIHGKQLILLGICVLSTLFIAGGMFLPWATLISGAESFGVPIFANNFTIYSNYPGTMSIAVVRFVSLLCALGCVICTFVIIGGVTEISAVGGASKYFFAIVTIVLGVAVVGVAIYYLIALNASSYFNENVYYTVGFGMLAIPVGTIACGVSLLLYK